MGHHRAYSSGESSTIIDRAMASLGLSDRLETDPVVIREVVSELRLNDLHSHYAPIAELIRRASSRPQSLVALVSEARRAILNKHPAIIEFLHLCLERNWLAPSPQFIRGLHVAYVLEAVTAAMCNSHSFFLELEQHHRLHKEKLGISSQHLLSSFWHILLLSHDVFGSTKAVSIDPTMVILHTQRKELERSRLDALKRSHGLNFLEYTLLSPQEKDSRITHIHELLRLNIYEAGITEFEKGLVANAACAFELAQNVGDHPASTKFVRTPVRPERARSVYYDSIAEEDNVFPVMELEQPWTSLYTTWNMAFVLFNYDDLETIMPKLCIPSVIGARSENFVGARAISLWLTVNHFLFRRADGRKKTEGPANNVEMSKAWAAINKRYALRLAKREDHQNPREFSARYRQWFHRPFFHFFQEVREFLMEGRSPHA